MFISQAIEEAGVHVPQRFHRNKLNNGVKPNIKRNNDSNQSTMLEDFLEIKNSDRRCSRTDPPSPASASGAATSPGDQVVGDLGDHGDLRAGSRQDRGVDALQCGSHKRDQFIDRSAWLSKGTITATLVSTFAQFALSSDTIESAGERGKGTIRLKSLARPLGPGEKGVPQLRELVRTNDIVLVSAIGALLDGANIHHLVLDQNMSIIEGSLGVLPRRILVHEDDNRQARQILSDAGLAHELRADD